MSDKPLPPARPKKMRRPVVECIWSGYVSRQSRPCHRTVGSWYANALKRNGVTSIQFTDGTNMSVIVREALHREKVEVIRGYDDLLGRVALYDLKGWVTVKQVNEVEAERKAATAKPVAAAGGDQP